MVFVVDVEIVSVQTTVLVIQQSTMDQIVKSITVLECKLVLVLFVVVMVIALNQTYVLAIHVILDQTVSLTFVKE
jgi:hypothetical protein